MAAGVMLLVAMPFLTFRSDGEMTVLQADIGQGDAAVLIFPDDSAVLIDTGESWRGGGSPLDRTVMPWLKRRNVDMLAGVVLSHAHGDHDGAAEVVAQALEVERWWLGGRTTAPDGATALRPAAGDTLHAVPPWSLVCLANGGPPGAEHENDRSLACGLVRDGQLAMLWTGDLELEGEEELLHRWPAGLIADGTILKAGHHGSRTSSGAPLLDFLAPATILASCGIESRHGHPSHGPFLSRGRPISLRRTDLEGSLQVTWEGAGGPRIAGTRTAP